jgi:hypothetical protein
MRLLGQMRQTGLLENYTVDSLLFELEKMKRIELNDGTLITTEQTKKQKDIRNALKICA